MWNKDRNTAWCLVSHVGYFHSAPNIPSDTGNFVSSITALCVQTRFPCIQRCSLDEDWFNRQKRTYAQWIYKSTYSNCWSIIVLVYSSEGRLALTVTGSWYAHVGIQSLCDLFYGLFVWLRGLFLWSSFVLLPGESPIDSVSGRPSSLVLALSTPLHNVYYLSTECRFGY